MANVPAFLTNLDRDKEHRIDCPECDSREGSKPLGVTIDADGRAVWHCFRCGFAGTWRDETLCERAGKVIPLNRQQHQVLSDYGRELWQSTRPIGGVAAAYLEARACALPPADGDLRWLPELRHPSGYVGPALVALVTDVATRQPISLHRTWIRESGDKADVDPPRLLLAGHRKDGGVIRLWPDEAVTMALTVAEGIETALTAALAFPPAWSCLDAGNLGKFAPLPGIEHLLIIADHDEAGKAAANACAARWYAAGSRVKVAMPPTPGEDLNDAARRSA